jgi:Protein of unknown function (DUF2877)
MSALTIDVGGGETPPPTPPRLAGRNGTVPPPAVVRAVAIGATAHGALVRARGAARVLARLSTSTYLEAGEEIVWLGGEGATQHPRAILTAAPPDAEADEMTIDVGAGPPWRPAALALDAETAATLADGWAALTADAAALGTPTGFGAWLVGAPLAFPLDGARGAAEALARACAHDDAAGATDAALALLGLGAGLTPSGDDFVGGAFFARALLATAGAADPEGWRRAALAVVTAAPAFTHPISVALVADLVAGLGWAPLHELVSALAARAPRAAAEAARRLATLGHSSGWDLLAGLGAGLGALA